MYIHVFWVLTKSILLNLNIMFDVYITENELIEIDELLHTFIKIVCLH